MDKDTQLTGAQASALREKVKNAANVATQGAINLAAALYEVFYGLATNAKGQPVPVAELWGFESFDDYVEKELHWHQTTGRSYVRVWDELFTRRSLDFDTLPDSMQQLRLLARISAQPSTDARELKTWITKSKQLSCCEFEAEVEANFGFGKGKRRNLGFMMPWNRVKSAMRTVATAKELYSVQTNGEALDKILADWAEGRSIKTTLVPATKKTG